MVSTYTTNKGLEQPSNGSYSGNWDVPLNTDMSLIDTAFGGATNLNATSGSAVLTVAQYRSLIINVTGAITTATGYTIPSGVGGSWIVNNGATGASVVFASAAGGSDVVTPSGSTTVIYCDGTATGMKAAGVSPNGTGASGTWNINITGNAATATTATTAGYATNAGNAVNATNATNATTATTADNVAGGYVSSLTGGTGITVSSAQGAITISATTVSTVGAVGTYAFCYNATGFAVNPGGTIAGSSLYYASAGGGGIGTSPTGTWQAMGYGDAGDSTLYLRIS